ncbi:ATP-binding protein [Microbulbifer sp. SH-1]|uniref:ATP-binding protein n=1 Tax=Microbulbifer sp. SH-1 TaxID=2681547 RepID=UPI00140951A3|nr:ATP-binding protein [Microbulbifer sp. SH-1]QIL91281.1 ATP-binding protein [Microbulbifer sp. SH-1]
MKQKIEQVLSATPGLKGRQIAHKLGLDKKDVNSYLNKQDGHFFKDENHCWFVVQNELMEIHLDGETWIDGLALDRSIAKVGSPLESACSSIHFIVPESCKIFLDAEARLLAYSNQCIHAGKRVVIDFNNCMNTLSWFDRNGFFEMLHKDVVVKPNRPMFSSAELFKGNSEAVYEFGEVDPMDLDEDIPQRLKHSFVNYAGVQYSQPAFTVLSELFGNVRDHSESPIPGYIALQHYKGFKGRRGFGGVKPHIQTIVSDSGRGITGTLKPVLQARYPEIFSMFDFSDPKSDPLLVREVFKRGRISQSSDEGRGLGLKRSGDVAASYDAVIFVREGKFELKLNYKSGKLHKTDYELGLPKLMGTHICFDFILAKD